MTAQVDPTAGKISGILSKLTFGTLAGDRDPIARLLQIDHDSIEGRLRAKEEAANPKEPKPLETKKVQEMEAHRDTLRARSTNFEDDGTVAGASIKLGGKR